MLDTSELSLTGALLAELDQRPTPQDHEAAALHVLDWLGCALAGAAGETGQAMAGAAGNSAGHPMSPSDRRAPELAWALGSFGSLLEMDDVHRNAILHPGPVVVPAVLACVTGHNAHRTTEAVLRGYEAMIRLGRSVGQSHYAHFHNTATCGGLGAAVGAAWMLNLTPTQTQWAMAHALSVSGGLWECRNEPGATKHLHVAEAARRGVQAAFAAQAGLAGPLRILEGEQGFFKGLARDGDPSEILNGDLWALHDTSFKPWPACRHAHPAIDAALALREALGGRMPDAIRIESYADSILFCDRETPIDGAGAKFSLQHSVAVALCDGAPPLTAFEGSALNAPKYVALRERTTVSEDAAMTARYPAHFGARVHLHLGDAVLTQTVPDAWGDSENPMQTADVVAKFRDLARHGGVSEAFADDLQTAALGLCDDTSGGEHALSLLGLMADLPALPPINSDA